MTTTAIEVDGPDEVPCVVSQTLGASSRSCSHDDNDNDDDMTRR